MLRNFHIERSVGVGSDFAGDVGGVGSVSVTHFDGIDACVAATQLTSFWSRAGEERNDGGAHGAQFGGDGGVRDVAADGGIVSFHISAVEVGHADGACACHGVLLCIDGHIIECSIAPLRVLEIHVPLVVLVLDGQLSRFAIIRIGEES